MGEHEKMLTALLNMSHASLAGFALAAVQIVCNGDHSVMEEYVFCVAEEERKAAAMELN